MGRVRSDDEDVDDEDDSLTATGERGRSTCNDSTAGSDRICSDGRSTCFEGKSMDSVGISTGSDGMSTTIDGRSTGSTVFSGSGLSSCSADSNDSGAVPGSEYTDSDSTDSRDLWM